MPAPHRLLPLLLLLGIAWSNALAGEREPVQRELELVYVFEGDGDPEYVFVIGQAGFKSVAALKQHIESWPKGSELRWAPGCKRFGKEPLLSSDEEMAAFRSFLESRGIRFVLVPSG